MSSKKTTTTKTTNSLPSWLTSPYQSAVSNAQNLASQPAISSSTQGAINNTMANAQNISNIGNNAIGSLSNLANGNFGPGTEALTGAASGDFLNSNPWTQTGKPIGVSTALNGFQQNGGLDTGYIDQSLLNKTANGDFLTADSNPYISGIAKKSMDDAQARINAQFGAAGRSNGSGLYAQLFGEGLADASNSVYAANYANERQLQQQAQGTLLGAQQGAREAALARQYGAAGSIFGAENSAAENAAGRASSAYEAERARQQSAAGGLLDARLGATSQIPGLLSAIMSGDRAALEAGQYQDEAEMLKAARQAGLLSTLAQPFGMQTGKATEKTSGLGNALNVYANLIGSFKSAAGAA